MRDCAWWYSLRDTHCKGECWYAYNNRKAVVVKMSTAVQRIATWRITSQLTTIIATRAPNLRRNEATRSDAMARHMSLHTRHQLFAALKAFYTLHHNIPLSGTLAPTGDMPSPAYCTTRVRDPPPPVSPADVEKWKQMVQCVADKTEYPKSREWTETDRNSYCMYIQQFRAGLRALRTQWDEYAIVQFWKKLGVPRRVMNGIYAVVNI